MFAPKDLSKVSSLRHGRQQELIARSLYSRKMQKMCKQFIVFYAGLVVNPSFPYLGASPDGKVYNPTEKDLFGLLEIKKILTHGEITEWRKPAGIQTSAFIWLMVSQNLKESDRRGHYCQVQGQLAITGLPWCDFIVQLSGSHNINVEWIYFNQTHWDENLFPQLKKFYFDRALPFLAKSING